MINRINSQSLPSSGAAATRAGTTRRQIRFGPTRSSSGPQSSLASKSKIEIESSCRWEAQDLVRGVTPHRRTTPACLVSRTTNRPGPCLWGNNRTTGTRQPNARRPWQAFDMDPALGNNTLQHGTEKHRARMKRSGQASGTAAWKSGGQGHHPPATHLLDTSRASAIQRCSMPHGIGTPSASNKSDSMGID